MGLWVIGVAIYVIGRTTMALGGNLQRYSMEKEKHRPELDKRARMRQPLLVTGLVLFVGSGIFQSSAVIFAPLSILAPCGVVFIVANAIFAAWLNGERFVWKEDGLCNLVIMVGVVLCISSAPKEEQGQGGGDSVHTYTDEELVALYQQATFAFYIVIVVTVVGLFMLAKYLILKGVDWDWSKLALDQTKITVVNLSYGCIAGMLGGFNVTLTKSMFSVIGGMLEGEGILGLLTSWLFYCLSAALLAAFLFQLVCITDGLEKCSAMVVMPCQAVCETLSTAFGGLLYFQDYKKFSTGTAFVFALGNLLAVIAVAVMVRLRMGHEFAIAVGLADEIEMPNDSGAYSPRSVVGNVLSISNSNSPTSPGSDGGIGNPQGHGFQVIQLVETSTPVMHDELAGSPTNAELLKGAGTKSPRNKGRDDGL